MKRPATSTKLKPTKIKGNGSMLNIIAKTLAANPIESIGKL